MHDRDNSKANEKPNLWMAKVSAVLLLTTVYDLTEGKENKKYIVYPLTNEYPPDIPLQSNVMVWRFNSRQKWKKNSC